MFEKNFKNEIVEIQGHKVGLGADKLIKIEIDRLPTGTLIEIPIYVFNGLEAGPTILLQAGLHGDEVNGVELVRKMLTKRHFKIKKGCLIVVPLLNVFGFLNLSRDVHGKDMNRSFPGSKTGSLASRIAYLHMKEIVKNIDFGIDFHTGGAQRSNYPQVRYTPKSEEGKKLAEIFNAPFHFATNLIPKSFRKEAHKIGIPIVVYEGGEALRFNKFAIRKGIEGALNILDYFEMIPKVQQAKNKAQTIELTEKRWVRAKIAGLFTSRVKNGVEVEKRQILGYITDTYGETMHSVRAPISGYVISLNNFPIINRGDALFRIGR